MPLGVGISGIGGGVKVGSAFGLVSIKSDTSGIKDIASALTSFNPISLAASVGMEAFNTAMFAVGTATTVATTAIIEGTKRFAEFDYTMTRVGALAQSTPGQLAEVTAEARRLGETSIYTAQQVAEGMNFLAMTGYDSNQIITAMPGLLDVAAVGVLDLGTTADIVSNILKGFNLDVEETARVGDVLVNAFTGSNTTLEKMGSAMAYVAPQAAALGFSIEEVSASIGILGDAGIAASSAGTILRGAFTRMAAPTAKAQGLMEDYGISFDDGTGNMKSYMKVMEELTTKLSNLGSMEQTAVLKEIVGLRAISGFQRLMKEFEKGNLQAFTEEMYATGTASEMADKMLDNLKGDVILLESVWDSFLMDIGEKWEPAMREFVQALMGFIQANRDEVTNWFGRLAGVIGPLMPKLLELAKIFLDLAFSMGNKFLDALPGIVTWVTRLAEAFMNGFAGSNGNLLAAFLIMLGEAGINPQLLQGIWDFSLWVKEMGTKGIEWIAGFSEAWTNLKLDVQRFFGLWQSVGLGNAFRMSWEFIFGEPLPTLDEIFANIKQKFITWWGEVPSWSEGLIKAEDFFSWLIDFQLEIAKFLGQLLNAMLNWSTQPDTEQKLKDVGELLGRNLLRWLGFVLSDDGEWVDTREGFLLTMGKNFVKVIAFAGLIGGQIGAAMMAEMISTISGEEYEAMTITELRGLFTRIGEMSDKYGGFQIGAAFIGQIVLGMIATQRDKIDLMAKTMIDLFYGAIAWAFGTDNAEADATAAKLLADTTMKLFNLALDVMMLGPMAAWGALFGKGLIGTLEDVLSDNKEIIDLMVEFGGQLVAGIVEGLTTAQPALDYGLQKLLERMFGTGEEEAEIHSPSDVAANRLGKPIGLGVAQGITDSISNIQDALSLGSLLGSPSFATGGGGSSSSQSLVIQGPLVSVSGGGDPIAIGEAVKVVLNDLFQQADTSGAYR